MVKEKLQRVRHDMKSLVKQQHIYHGHYQTPGGSLRPGSDCDCSPLDAGSAYPAVWSTEPGGHSPAQLLPGAQLPAFTSG